MLPSETVFIYLELDKLKKLDLIQVLDRSRNELKTWSRSSFPTLLSSVLLYLESICKDTNITAVFVSCRSAQLLHRLLQVHQPGNHFSSWVDLASCVSHLGSENQDSVSSCDGDKLAQLVGHSIKEGAEATVMEKIFSTSKTVETHNWQMREGSYLTVVINMGIFKDVQDCQTPVMATLGMHSSAGVDWSVGVIPDDVKVVVNPDQTDSLGIKFIETEKKWVLQQEVGKCCDCLTSKEAVHSMLLFLEEQVQGGQLQGVQLVTVLDDFTLNHLLTLVKTSCQLVDPV